MNWNINVSPKKIAGVILILSPFAAMYIFAGIGTGAWLKLALLFIGVGVFAGLSMLGVKLILD